MQHEEISGTTRSFRVKKKKKINAPQKMIFCPKLSPVDPKFTFCPFSSAGWFQMD